MTISRFSYVRNTVTGVVGINTGFAAGARVCVNGVWHDSRWWVAASETEWNETHR